MTSGGAAALEVHDASFAYRTGRRVLRGVSLDVLPGEITMVLGMSGSGKTTLLKLCKGLLAPQHGEVRVLGESVRAGGRRGRLDPRVAYIPQQLGLVRSLTALENTLVGALGRVGVVPSLAGLFPAADVRRARELLERLGIGHKLDEQVFALSGGERQRVAIARSLMQGPRVLLADELISDLDPVTSANIMRIVRSVAEDGVAIVMTTHEMDVVREHAEHVVVLRDGEKALDVRARLEPSEIAAAFQR